MAPAAAHVDRAVPGAAPPPARILFVLPALTDSALERELILLAQSLDRTKWRLDVVVCLGDCSDDSHLRFQAYGIDVDRVPYKLSLEDTVDYLAGRIGTYDVIVAGPDVEDIGPALAQLASHPPFIQHDGASHRTLPAHDLAAEWEERLGRAVAARVPAPPPSQFASFIQGGFECSTHVLRTGRRLDLLAATHHAANVEADYLQLAGHGIRTVRDGLRWHLIEPSQGRFDWSSFLPMVRAASDTGTQPIWDLMHYGWPDEYDIWSPTFPDRVAAFAANAAQIVKSETDAVPFYCPINEISFHSWAGGDVGYLNPFARHRGFELKVQLARASIAAMRAILAVEPRARFVHCEPLINIVDAIERPEDRQPANEARLAQFQAFDMIAGRMWPQLGGAPELLDIVGVNYYPGNQWIHGGAPIAPGHPLHKPLRTLLAEVYARYGRPILVAETGCEDAGRSDWFDNVSSEVGAARRNGIPVEGICLYPIIDHVGWDDDRDCPSGLLENRFANGVRPVHHPLAEAIRRFRMKSIAEQSTQSPGFVTAARRLPPTGQTTLNQNTGVSR